MEVVATLVFTSTLPSSEKAAAVVGLVKQMVPRPISSKPALAMALTTLIEHHEIGSLSSGSTDSSLSARRKPERRDCIPRPHGSSPNWLGRTEIDCMLEALS